MIRSMTGFGAAEGRVGTLRVSVELRTVNHRFFNPSIKLPLALGRWEGEVRELLGIVGNAVSALDATRLEEGARVAAVLLDRIAILEHAYERIAARSPVR